MLPVCQTKDCSAECFTCHGEIDDRHAVVRFDTDAEAGHFETRTYHIREDCMGELANATYLAHELDGHTHWVNFVSPRQPKQSADSPATEDQSPQSAEQQPASESAVSPPQEDSSPVT